MLRAARARLLPLVLPLLPLGAAGVRTAAAEEPEGGALTAFEAGPWRRASLVVVADVVDVRATGPDVVRGFLAARARVERTLKGDPPGAELVFLVRGPRPTLDPKAPSAPYLVPGSGGRFVLFLERRSEGVAYGLASLIEVEGAVGEERLESLVAEAALLAIPDPEERARSTLEHFLGSLRRGGVWTRVHAARELNHLASVRPDLFDAAARSRVAVAWRAPGTPAQREWLQRLLRALGTEVPSTPPPEDDAEPRPGTAIAALLAAAGPDPAARRAAILEGLERGGDAAVPALLDAFRSEERLVRVWVADALAEGGYRAALAPLRRAYAAEEDPDVRAAIVRATGLLGSDEDVPWLVERAANPRLATEALAALARVRSETAVRWLREAGRRAAEGATPEERDIARWVDYLLSDAFVEAERAAGRAVGPRPPGPGGRR